MKDSDEESFEETSDDNSSVASEDEAQTKDSNRNRKTSCGAVRRIRDSRAKIFQDDVEKRKFRREAAVIQALKGEPKTKSAKSLNSARQNTAGVGKYKGDFWCLHIT